jgi:hypothetical protein
LNEGARALARAPLPLLVRFPWKFVQPWKFSFPLQAMMSQLLLGLVNGSFYAMLSLGLAVIFGLLNVINFSHGACT